MIVVERTEGGPASAPVEADVHSTGVEQVCDVDSLPECRPEVIVRAVHETRIIALRSAGTVSETGEAVVTKTVRQARPTLSEMSACVCAPDSQGQPGRDLVRTLRLWIRVRQARYEGPAECA